jgi:succinate dehydrogenase flavin-adding protein (antitoxin of CptAB toxin-antitoxin module)
MILLATIMQALVIIALTTFVNNEWNKGKKSQQYEYKNITQVADSLLNNWLKEEMKKPIE